MKFITFWVLNQLFVDPIKLFSFDVIKYFVYKDRRENMAFEKILTKTL